MDAEQQIDNQAGQNGYSTLQSTSHTSWLAAFLICSLFLSCIALPWWWFHSGTTAPIKGFKIETTRNVPGFIFTDIPVSKSELQILATTNLLSGVFVPETEKNKEPVAGVLNGKASKRIRIFAAEWSAQSGRNMSVVHHTPDICWVGAGWESITLGQPHQVNLEIPTGASNPESERTIIFPFECRVFRPPNGGIPELTLWCTLVGGQILPEVHLYPVNDAISSTGQDNISRMGPYGRRLATSHLWQLVRRRLPAQASKQFIRLSAPITDSWESALEFARTFTVRWIQADKLDTSI